MIYSHSSLKQFDTCPKQWHAIRVAKTAPRESSPAAERGNAIHASLEQQVKSYAPDSQLASLILSLVKDRPDRQLSAERTLYLTPDMTPCDDYQDDGYMVKIDVLVLQSDRAVVLDYKTGKRWVDDSFFDQLRRTGVVLKKHFPNIRYVLGGYHWLRTQTWDFDVMTERDLALETLRLHHDVNRVRAATDFPANPSGLCKKYCSVADCIHNGRRMGNA